jgi:hypothetical protein
LERALGGEAAVFRAEREYVGREAGTELGGDGRPVTHPVYGEWNQDPRRAPLVDERFDSLLVHVVFELVLLDRDGEDRVDAVDIDGVREGRRIARDDGDLDRAPEILRCRDELEGDGAKVAAEVLGDDEGARHQFRLTFGRVPARSARDACAFRQ